MEKPSPVPFCSIMTVAFALIAIVAWAYGDPHAPNLALGAVFAGFITLAAWAYEQLKTKE